MGMYFDRGNAVGCLTQMIEHILVDLKHNEDNMRLIDYKMKLLIKEIIEYYKIYEGIDLMEEDKE